MWMPRYTSAKLPLPMWCRRLNLPMTCPSPVAAAEGDGDAPDRRGFAGDAMVAALSPAEVSMGPVSSYQQRRECGAATGAVHMGCRLWEGVRRDVGTMRWRVL
jgi:hypothetical protein